MQHRMKRFRWKAAIITFLVLLAVNGVLLMLDSRYPDSSAIIAISRVVQLPGLPLIFIFPVPFSAGDDYTWDYTMAGVVSASSALVWSVLAGFFICRDRAS